MAFGRHAHEILVEGAVTVGIVERRHRVGTGRHVGEDETHSTLGSTAERRGDDAVIGGEALFRHLPMERDADLAIGRAQAVDTDLEVCRCGLNCERGRTGERDRQCETLDGCGWNGHHISS